MTTTITRRSSVHLLPGLAIEEERQRCAREYAADTVNEHMVRVHVRTLMRLEGRYPYNRDAEAWDDAVRRATGGY